MDINSSLENLIKESYINNNIEKEKELKSIIKKKFKKRNYIQYLEALNNLENLNLKINPKLKEINNDEILLTNSYFFNDLIDLILSTKMDNNYKTLYIIFKNSLFNIDFQNLFIKKLLLSIDYYQLDYKEEIKYIVLKNFLFKIYILKYSLNKNTTNQNLINNIIDEFFDKKYSKKNIYEYLFFNIKLKDVNFNNKVNNLKTLLSKDQNNYIISINKFIENNNIKKELIVDYLLNNSEEIFKFIKNLKLEKELKHLKKMFVIFSIRNKNINYIKQEDYDINLLDVNINLDELYIIYIIIISSLNLLINDINNFDIYPNELIKKLKNMISDSNIFISFLNLIIKDNIFMYIIKSKQYIFINNIIFFNLINFNYKLKEDESNLIYTKKLIFIIIILLIIFLIII